MLEELKVRHAQDRNVVFHGFVSDEQKLAVLAKARIFILPSEREGLPKSIVECMACGVPTVTTDYPKMAERTLSAPPAWAWWRNPNRRRWRKR